MTTKGFTGRGDTSLTLVVKDKTNKVNTSDYRHHLSRIMSHLKKEKDVKSVLTLLNAPASSHAALTGKDNHTSIGFISLKTEEGYAINELPAMEQRLDMLLKKNT
ncbi:hypothetical protein QS257_03005 [Terrilactibacillus sp. S3-3]|nr:hypothetical protein QS257_03005 [Terrilactibacillus sp. S3-3]